MNDGYESSEAYIRRMSMLSSRELARYLDEASTENRRLSGWVENAKYVIGILVVALNFMILACCSEPVEFGMPGSDYGRDIIGPFQ